jgi:hypothetical protein
MDLIEIGFEDADWIHLTQNRAKWLNLCNDTPDFMKCGKFLEWLSYY